MNLVDVNVLLAAINTKAPHHLPAKALIESTLNGGGTLALCWVVIVGFLRITTRPPVFDPPLTTTEAWDFLDAWLDSPRTMIVDPGPTHPALFRDLVLRAGIGGNLLPDAHLAALAIERNATLYSFDRDFGRFPKLKWRIPGA